MKLFITSDANSETRVGEAHDFSEPAKMWFKDRGYGSGLDGVGIIITCRLPAVRQRIRLHKQKNTPESRVMVDPTRIAAGEFSKPVGVWFDMDLMLDYDEIVKRRHREEYSGIVSAALHHRSDKEREQFIRERIVQEVPAVLRKYVSRKKNPLKDFDVDAFERDLRKCLLEGGVEAVMPAYEAEVEKERQRWQRHKEKTGRDILLPGEELPEL